MLLLVFLFCLKVVGIVHSFVPSSWHLWRSSETGTADTNVLVASGAVFLRALVVVEAGVASTFRYFNSENCIVKKSSSIVYVTVNTGDIYPLEDYLSKGFCYTTAGTAKIRLIWDWYSLPQRGQLDKGRK